MNKKFKGILDLCRISNLPTVISNCVASWLVAGGSFDEFYLVAIVSGAVLLYSGGMIMNDLFDLVSSIRFSMQECLKTPVSSKKMEDHGNSH